MKKNLLFAVLLFLSVTRLFATHNRAGEITYTHISGYTYGITVTTYTRIGPTISADRCELTVYFGDGDSAKAPRINGPIGGCSPMHEGVVITSDTKLNVYYIEHTYPGPNTYNITMEDQNRNAGICNIPGSVNASFFLVTQLIINPFLPPNSSPVLLNPPIDNACVGQCFEHNPGAYDAEGDSLYYRLTTCYANGAPILGYSLPPNMSSSSINHFTGDIDWCVPTTICQYNVAIIIEEWKLFPGSYERFFAGSILRDMQIDVASCSNTQPTVDPIPDTCVIAGTNVNFSVTAHDADNNLVTLSATGGPFEVTPGASFVSSSTIGSATGTFNWTPNCSEVQYLPYQVTFKATDNDLPTPLVNFETMEIRVIAPAPQNLTATPSGASIILNWLAPSCNSLVGANPLKGYLVYRKDACEPWFPGICETGVPAYTGYTYIGTVNAPTTTFTDDNGGIGLTPGIDYSYLVVAYYADGAQSIASNYVCAHLVRDVPIITNVSVISTGTNDSIWTHWLKPVGDVANLDTIANPPPYEFRLMRAIGTAGSLSYSAISSYNYSAFWQLTDTGFVSSALNTQDSAFTYRVDFYSNGIQKGSTHTASSVYLSTVAGDKSIQLNWQEFVPWTNYRYDVYRKDPSASSFAFIDSTHTQSYLDTGLVNGYDYCYKIVSIGQYSDPALPRPLFNNSEIKCARPMDITPPCQPIFQVASDCGIENNVLSWSNPNNYCCSDAIQYNIYFTPNNEDPLTIIYTTNNMNDTTYSHVYDYDGVPSVAGCYAVTAVDSAGNESPIVSQVCVDNCPNYELPNVFTPNGDNQNDFFVPLPYKYVKDIDIKIYDRWGLLMFETTDPQILWDGKNKDSKMTCSDGTYYYICKVNEIRLEGIVPRTLKGFVQLINPSTTPNH